MMRADGWRVFPSEKASERLYIRTSDRVECSISEDLDCGWFGVAVVLEPYRIHKGYFASFDEAKQACEYHMLEEELKR